MVSILQEFAAKILLGLFDYLVGTFTENKPVLLDTEIAFSEVLTTNIHIFLSEYRNVVETKKLNDIKDFYKVKKDINEDDKWKAEPLILFSYLFKENAAKCPQTYNIVSQIPGCVAVMFSVLGPGKYIPPHKGIYRGIYRCLLTLSIEEKADCWIRVNDKKIYFTVGKLITFDETAEHEVRNDSNSDRVALYMDIYRKLPFPLNIYNRLLYFIIRRSPFVTNILREYKKLENSTVVNYNPPKAIKIN